MESKVEEVVKSEPTVWNSKAVQEYAEGKKPIESNLKILHAVETPLSERTKTMKIEPTVSLVKRVDYFQSVCSYTGIVIEIAVPKIQGLVLEYVSPLSYWDNVKGLIDQGEEYLSNLELQILAGLWITAYRHFELIDLVSTKNNSSLLNAMLRTAGKKVLVDSLLMAGHLTVRYARRCARFDISYQAHKEAPNMKAAIQEYTRAVRDSVFPPEALVLSKEEQEIENKYHERSYVLKTKANHKITTVQEQFDDKFKVARREGKVLLKAMAEEMIIPTAFISILKTVFTDKNLISMDSKLREKMITKLNSYQNANCQKMAKVLAEGCNPYDIFALEATELSSDKIMNEVPETNRKLSLKEILEAKRKARLEAESSASSESASISSQVAEHFNEEQNKAGDVDTSGEEF